VRGNASTEFAVRNQKSPTPKSTECGDRGARRGRGHLALCQMVRAGAGLTGPRTDARNSGRRLAKWRQAVVEHRLTCRIPVIWPHLSGVLAQCQPSPTPAMQNPGKTSERNQRLYPSNNLRSSLPKRLHSPFIPVNPRHEASPHSRHLHCVSSSSASGPPFAVLSCAAEPKNPIPCCTNLGFDDSRPAKLSPEIY
jgi:hypothetical protein